MELIVSQPTLDKTKYYFELSKSELKAFNKELLRAVMKAGNNERKDEVKRVLKQFNIEIGN